MKTMIQQSNNIIFFKEQHIFAIGDREIYVYDSMNFVELEHYSLEESISVMRFSLKGRYIYGISVLGNLLVVDRFSKKVVKGDRLRIRRMNYEPEVYDHSLVLPLSEDRGFAIVLKGERYYQPIDDWYFVGNDGNVLSFLTFGGKEQKEKQTSFVLNDYLTDGVFYLGCVQHSNLLRFDPETLELRMVYEEKKAKYPLESKNCSYFFASEKKNRVLLGFQHSQLEYHSWVCRLPQTSSDDWSTLVECDLTKAQTIAHYPAFLNCARLNVVQMFDYDSMSTYDIPAKYRRHEEYEDAELYCFDSVTIAIQHRFIDIYDSRNDRLVFRMSERSLK